MKKRLIKSEFFDSRDPGSDFIEIFKNPNSVEVDKIKNSNSYKSLNGLISPNGDIFIWRGDLNADSLNVSTINTNNGIKFSFFPEWNFDANFQYDFEKLYDVLQMKKAGLAVVGDLTRSITVSNATDTDRSGDYSFSDWTSMENSMEK
jgi:hypothetical protein